MDSEELFEIERIEKDCFMLDYQGKYQRHYYIKWVDYPPDQNSWEPRSNLMEHSHLIVNEYESKYKIQSSSTKQSLDVMEQNTHKVPVVNQESSDSSDSDCPIMAMALPTATINTQHQQTSIKKKKAPIQIQTNSKESHAPDSEDEPIATTTAFERIPKYLPWVLPQNRRKKIAPQNRHKKIAPPPTKKRKVITHRACTRTIDLISDDEMPILPSKHVSNPTSIRSSKHKKRYNTDMHKKRYNRRKSTQQNTIKCSKCLQIGHWARDCTICTKKNDRDVTTNFLYSVYPCVTLDVFECAVSSCPSILSMPSMDSSISQSHKEKRHRHRHGDRRRHKHKHKERHKRHKSSRHKKERSYDSNHNRSINPPSMAIEGDLNAPPPPPKICPVYLEQKPSIKRNGNRNKNINLYLEMPIPSVKTHTSRFRIFGCDANIMMCAQDIIHVKPTWDAMHIDEELCENKNEDDQSESRQQSVPMSISTDST